MLVTFFWVGSFMMCFTLDHYISANVFYYRLFSLSLIFSFVSVFFFCEFSVFFRNQIHFEQQYGKKQFYDHGKVRVKKKQKQMRNTYDVTYSICRCGPNTFCDVTCFMIIPILVRFAFYILRRKKLTLATRHQIRLGRQSQY